MLVPLSIYIINTHIESNVATPNAVTRFQFLDSNCNQLQWINRWGGQLKLYNFNKLKLLKLNKYHRGHFKLPSFNKQSYKSSRLASFWQGIIGAEQKHCVKRTLLAYPHHMCTLDGNTGSSHAPHLASWSYWLGWMNIMFQCAS